MKRFVSIALVVLMIAALFVGCSSNGSLDGTYKVKAIDGKAVMDYFTEAASKSGVDVAQALSAMGLSADTLTDMLNITLKSDGTAEVSTKMSEDENSTGTWKQDGDQIIVTIDGDDQVFTLKDGELTTDLGGMTMTLGK